MRTSLDPWPDWMACPACHERLEEPLACTSCGIQWPYRNGVPDLIPDAMDTGDWRTRLDVCTRYYRDLIADPQAAATAFGDDLQAVAPLLSVCRGRVIDVGGGHGLARDVLPRDAEYVSVDPDVTWLDPAWQALEAAFPSLRTPLAFVRGVAEALPCGNGSFDHALMIFSLNHCADPARACLEVARVLRPGGTWILVLEDAEPSWRDAGSGAYRDWRGWSHTRVLLEKVRAVISGWPLEPDHVRISERDVDTWTQGHFAIQTRAWRGSYRVLVLRRH